MPLTLSTVANNYQVYKVQIAAALAGVDVNVDEVKTVHDKKPLASSPVLDTGAGLVFQSNAIMRYLARSAPNSLAYGDSVLASAQVDQWIDYCLNQLEPARGVWMFPVLKMMDLNMKSYNAAKKDVSRVLKTLNTHLQSNTYFVGHSPTIADAAIFAALLDMYSTVFSPNYRKGFVNVNRWFNTVAHHPAFAGVVGEVTMCTEEKRAEMPKKKEKAKKQPKQQQKKEKKAAPPKPKHWSQLLEKSEMNLDATKKSFFCKKPFNPEFFPGFWDTFDAKGYSFYTAVYNYNDEHEVFWKTENMVAMFIQKLLYARKYAQGVLTITGAEEEKGPWCIEGLFMFRGLVTPPEVMDTSGAEYYTWTKLDISTAAAKATVEAFWCNDVVDERNILTDRKSVV